jgi:hypothetical protein
MTQIQEALNAVQDVCVAHRLDLTANIPVNNICKEIFHDTRKVRCEKFADANFERNYKK